MKQNYNWCMAWINIIKFGNERIFKYLIFCLFGIRTTMAAGETAQLHGLFFGDTKPLALTGRKAFPVEAAPRA